MPPAAGARDCPRLIAKFWPGPGRAGVVILAGARSSTVGIMTTAVYYRITASLYSTGLSALGSTLEIEVYDLPTPKTRPLNI